jgi:hypothetical protein
MKLKLLLALVAATLLLTACPRTPTPPTPEPGEAQLRALHGVADAPNVDILVDGEVVLANVAYKQGSGYLSVEEGEQAVQVRASGDAEAVVLAETLELAAGAAYTLIVLGEAAEDSDFPIEALLLEDSTEAPDAGNLKVRVVHGVPGAPNVDVYVTGPAGELVDPVLEDVSYKGFNEEYLEVPGGDYRIRLTAAGDEAVLYDSATVTLAANAVYTLVALPETDEGALSPLTLVVLSSGELPPVDELPDQTPPPASEAGLELTATVGASADTCATTTSIVAAEGQEVYFCYTITNTGEVTIPLHSLADEVSGVILRDFAFELEPGASINTVQAGVTISAVLEETTVNRAVWDGYVGSTRVATAEASTTVTVVGEDDEPPFDYAVAAGTFVGDSNSATVGPFDGNALLIRIRNLDGSPIEQEVVVNITVPGIGAFPYTFDPDEAVGGVVALILHDFEESLEPTMLQGLGVPVKSLALEPQLAVQAAVGGEFVFAFPGETLTRTVDADAKLTVPTVTEVTLDEARETLTVAFESAGEGVSYQVSAFGRGMNAHSGTTEVDASPATVTLSGALEEEEAYVVDLLAVRGGGDPFDETVSQFDVGAYLHYSE